MNVKGKWEISWLLVVVQCVWRKGHELVSRAGVKAKKVLD